MTAWSWRVLFCSQLMKGCPVDERTAVFTSLREHAVVARRPKLLAILSRVATGEVLEGTPATFMGDAGGGEGDDDPSTAPASASAAAVAPDGSGVVTLSGAVDVQTRGVPGPMFRSGESEYGVSVAIPATAAAAAAMPSWANKAAAAAANAANRSNADQQRFDTTIRRSIKNLVRHKLLPLAVCYAGCSIETQRLLLQEVMDFWAV